MIVTQAAFEHAIASAQSHAKEQAHAWARRSGPWQWSGCTEAGLSDQVCTSADVLHYDADGYYKEDPATDEGDGFGPCFACVDDDDIGCTAHDALTKEARKP